MSDELLELPDGWEWTTLENLVIKIIGGGTPSKANPTYYQGNIPWMTVKDMTSRRPQIITDYINIEAIINSATNLIPADTIIIATRMSLGKIVRVPFEVAINQDLKALILPKSIEKDFIEYWFISEAINIQSLGTGTTVKGIRLEILNQLKVPLPPLNEQKRIVAKIEELNDRTQKAKEALEAIPQLCDRFRQSVLAAAFRGDLTADWRENNPDVETALEILEKSQLEHNRYYIEECAKAKTRGEHKPKEPTYLGDYELAWQEEVELPESWTLVPLGKVCIKITDGTHDTPKPVDIGVPYITAQHIKAGFIDFDNSLFLSENDHKTIYSRCNPEKGDVLIVNIGAGTATPAIVNVDFEFSMKNIALLKPDKNVIDSQYLEYYQIFIRPRIFSQVSRGGAQPFMGLNLIRTIPFILPPIQEQKEIIAKIKALFNTIECLNKYYQKLEYQYTQLNQSILSKAFRGELVPQDPDDEPASVLLERIRAEREKLNNTKSKSKRTSKPKSKTPEGQETIPGLE